MIFNFASPKNIDKVISDSKNYVAPRFKKVIGIAMIKKPFFKIDQKFDIHIEGNKFLGNICKLPF